MTAPYPLSDKEKRAIDAASVAMSGEPDALALMNSLCQWPDPPQMDERWERKIAAACEIAVAFCKQAQNYKADLKADRDKRHKMHNAVAAFLNGSIDEYALAERTKLFNNRGKDNKRRQPDAP